MIVSRHWLPEERLNLIGEISARWGNNIHSAPKEEWMEALKVIRMLARLNTEVCELNRDMIMQFTRDAELTRKR